MIKRLIAESFKLRKIIRNNIVSVNNNKIDERYLNYSKLHLGCGSVYFKNYLNVDISKYSVADVVMDYQKAVKQFSDDTLDEIVMIHSIGYLKFWEAIDLFSLALKKVKPSGKLIMEFPDIINCSKKISESSNDNNLEPYIEGVRAFYAFDLTQIKEKQSYNPYAMGWSGWHMAKELKKIGFSKVNVTTPVYHEISWRDCRVEAIK